MKTKRFLLDNDTTNIIHRLGDDVSGAVAEAVRECPPNVTTYLLCSGAGTCYWPTEIGHVDSRAEGLLAAHKRGLDPLRMLLEGMKQSGKETFITYRMNDVHNPTDGKQWNTPRIRREHPDCIVGMDEVKAGNASWMSYCMDYTRDDVRQYVLSLIREQITLYGGIIDGFQVDWMRFPRHLSGKQEEVWAKRSIITEFMSQVRSILNESGNKILLSARVPTSPVGCRMLGFDIHEWAEQGLIDLLVVCPFLTTEWSIPFDEFRNLLNGKEIPVYGGFDFGFGKQKHFPESLRGICSSLYDCGADGIYIFNFPCWTEYLASRPYHWLCCLDKPETASAKPLLFAVEHAHNRIPGTDQKASLPANIPDQEMLLFPIRVPAAALPAWRGMVLVNSHGNINLSVNGSTASEVYLNGTSVYRSEIFLEYFNKDVCPVPEDCRLFRVDPACLTAGDNRLEIMNVSGKELEIERINLTLW